jgi:hypothetical protein
LEVWMVAWWENLSGATGSAKTPVQSFAIMGKFPGPPPSICAYSQTHAGSTGRHRPYDPDKRCIRDNPYAIA